MIQNEIDYLSIYPKIGGWSTESYINSIKENTLNFYTQKNLEIDLSNKEKKIHSQLIQLLKKFKEKETNKHAHQNLKETFISVIQNEIENNPSEELLEKCKKKYDYFIKLISKNDSSHSKENIIWPFIPRRTINENEFTKNIKLYQHILWYSQASSVIDKISGQKDIKAVKNISDLCEISDMKGISSYLISRIIKNNKNERKINKKDLDIIQSTIRALFICKLIEDDLFDKINELYQILNDLENRKSKDSEMNWINQYVSKYPADLQIVLPYFVPNDIFYLVVCYENDKTTSCGPYLKIKKLISQDIADSLKECLKKKTTNDKTKFAKYSVSVCIEIYRIMVNKSPNIPNNYDDFKSFINDELESCKPDKDKKKEHILNSILFILQINEKLQAYPQNNFTFNDTLFLKKNWINNEPFVNKYPSLLYWLSLNEYFAEQLQRSFKNYEFSENKLPFWLFAVRIMSSLRCIEFNSENQSKIASLIKNTISKCTLQYFEKSRTTKYYGTKWINFLLPKVPPEIFNYNYKMLYQFFINLSQETPSNIKLIDEKKESIIESFSQEITNLVFKDRVDDLFNMKFYRKDEVNDLSFIYDPRLKVDHEINNHLNELFSSFINDGNYKLLKDCSNNINMELNSFIEKLKKLVQKENESIEYRYNQDWDDKYQNISNEIWYLVNRYNSLLNELMVDCKMKMRDFLPKINELNYISINRYMKRIPRDKSQVPLKINIFSHNYSSKGDYYMQIIFNNSTIQSYTFNKNRYELYFREKDFSFDDLNSSQLIAYSKKKRIRKKSKL